MHEPPKIPQSSFAQPWLENSSASKLAGRSFHHASVRSVEQFEGLNGEPDLFTIKIHYNGRFKDQEKRNEYIGGSFEYFDSVDLDKLGMIELWAFMEELGFEEKRSFRFWHKVGGTINEGRYLKNDSDVLNLRNHIPINYEVEIYVQHLDDGNHEAGDENDEFDNNEYDFDENDGLLDAFVCDDIEPKGKLIVHEGEKTEDVIYNMQEDSEEDVCADSDGLNSIHDSDEDEDGVKKYPLFDPKKDSEKPELKLGLVFSSKKEAKFAIESYCIREGRPVKFVKNDNIRLWAKCNDDNCHWKIHVAKMSNDNCWQVRNFDICHSNCIRDLKNKCVNSTWLGNTFAKKFSTNHKLGWDTWSLWKRFLSCCSQIFRGRLPTWLRERR
ncbi:uncharacterized protein [Henckelia pumila]|uniref:uncharacterized protein n=1 Tax=Henckelia pumila TaxID=405737 RepID=UPI003C6E22D1